MKKAIIACIRLYQGYLALPLRLLTGATFSCKFTPTCSEYAASIIDAKGIIKGGVKALGRFVSCQPFIQRA